MPRLPWLTLLVFLSRFERSSFHCLFAEKLVRTVCGCTASVGGSSDIAAVLIRHKANINATGKNNRSVVMLAVLSGNVSLVELLLRENVDISSKTRVRAAFQLLLYFNRF
jgi:hypothetical protein